MNACSGPNQKVNWGPCGKVTCFQMKERNKSNSWNSQGQRYQKYPCLIRETFLSKNIPSIQPVMALPSDNVGHTYFPTHFNLLSPQQPPYKQNSGYTTSYRKCHFLQSKTINFKILPEGNLVHMSVHLMLTSNYKWCPIALYDYCLKNVILIASFAGANQLCHEKASPKPAVCSHIPCHGILKLQH